MRIAIHQPNFIPWFPFFYKMAMVDYFIIMDLVQFEKNGYQNRFRHKGKWITKPVEGKKKPIIEKCYADGSSLLKVNMAWIYAIKETLGIQAEVTFSRNSSSRNFLKSFLGSPTSRILDLLHDIQDRDRWWRGEKLEKRRITYVTNPLSKDKYLDEKYLESFGINIDYCKVPKNLHKSIFEMFEEYGIEGTKKQLPKYKIEFYKKIQDKEEVFQKLNSIALECGTESKEYSEAKQWKI